MDASVKAVEKESLVPKLQLEHIFGIKQDRNKNLEFVTDNKILYIAGHEVVLQSIEERNQSLIYGSDDSLEITQLILSPNKKYVAVTEKGLQATIKVYCTETLKALATLLQADSTSNECVSIAFCPDSQHLVSIGGHPEWIACYWRWNKSKLLAYTSLSRGLLGPREVSFHPENPNLFCAVGSKCFFLFCFQNGRLKNISNAATPFLGDVNASCHLWFDTDRLLVFTETGEIRLFDDKTYQFTQLACSPFQKDALLCVSKISNGFICGGYGSMVRVYETSEDPLKVFEQTSVTQLPLQVDDKVVALAISPSETVVAALSATNELYLLNFSYSAVTKTRVFLAMKISESLFSQSHFGAVTGMDVCVSKPIVATCGADRSIRIWNFITKHLELCKQFWTDMFCISIHPMGYYILVGFSDKLRLMNVLKHDIIEAHDFAIKACKICRFSHGGRYFAAVNANWIEVYESFTYQKLLTLSGHSLKILCLSWVNDDTRLVSGGVDGVAYQYNIAKGGQHESKWMQHGTSVTSVVVDCDPVTYENSIFAVGTDMILKRIQGSQTTLYVPTFHSVRNLALVPFTQSILATAADEERAGFISCYHFATPGQHDTYQCHSKPSTAIRIVAGRAISASEDGTLCIFSINSSQNAKNFSIFDELYKDSVTNGEVTLVSKSFLDEKDIKNVDLKFQVETLHTRMNNELKQQEANHKKELQAVVDTQNNQLGELRGKMETMQQERYEIEDKLNKKLQENEDRYAEEAAALNSSFQKKLSLEIERQQELVQEQNQLKEGFNSQIEKIIEDARRDAMGVAANRLAETNTLKAEIHKLTQENDRATRVHQELLSQAYDDTNLEIEKNKLEAAKKLEAERNEKFKYKALEIVQRKKCEDLSEKALKVNNEMELRDESCRKLLQEIEKREKARETISNELAESSKLVKEKSHKIRELEQKVSYLEQTNLVSSNKIDELNALISPKDEKITELKLQVKNMEGQLESLYFLNNQTQLEIPQLKKRNAILQKDAQHLRKKLVESASFIRSIRNDIFECTQNSQEPKQLKKEVSFLFKKYARSEIEQKTADRGLEEELLRQRDHLEKTISSLKLKLKKDSAMHRIDNTKVMHENASLIHEVNELRKDLHNLKQDQQVYRQKMIGLSLGSKRKE